MRKIPFSPPDIGDAEIEEVVQALRSGWITTGPRTKLLEEKLAAYTGCPRAVCLNSATAAMEITLRVLGIGPGDEVITSAYTYTATAAVIAHVGAKIVLADTAPDSFEMDYEQLPELITERTKAVIPVDLGGKMCDYDKIYQAVESKKHLFVPANDLQALFGRIFVLADGAHSFGAVRKGQRSGQAADCTCFSFHAVKNLTTAEGGAAVWRERPGLDQDALYREYMLHALHGQTKDAFSKLKPGAWEYDIMTLGYKCNMTDILAAVGLKQLERYAKILARRHEIIRCYDAAMDRLGILRLVHSGGDFTSSGHLYLVRVPGIGEAQRNEIIADLAQNGVSANVHYKPLPMMTAYRNAGFEIADFPHAYRQYENEITLPLHTLLTDDDVSYVIDQFQVSFAAVNG